MVDQAVDAARSGSADSADPAAPAGNGSDTEDRDTRRPSWLRWEFFAFLELFALCGFVFAQPVLDVTSESPEFFLFHQAGTADILIMVVVFTIGPPIALWCLAALTRLGGRRTRAGAQVLLIAGLLSALGIQIGKPLSPLHGLTLGVIAAVAAAVLVVVYLQIKVARSVLRMAAVGPVVFALLFVFSSPVSNVVLASDEQTATTVAANSDYPPVVIMLLDEFPLVSLLGPDGKVDAARYPNFAELAGESTWYRNSTGVAGLTVNAVPTMLTGQYPPGKIAPHYIEYPDNMFSLFSEHYKINAYEGVTRLCEPWRCNDGPVGATDGLRNLLKDGTKLLTEIASPDEAEQATYDTFREPTLQERRELAGGPDFRLSGLGDNQPIRFHDFMQGLEKSDTPTLNFLHLLVPHRPWKYLASGNSYESIPDIDFKDQAPGESQAWVRWWLQISQQRYLQQAQYADLLLGETIRAMRDKGVYDDALFVVTGDHGISFTPGAFGRGLDPKYKSAAELLWVPTFVKAPNQTEGAIDDRNWEHVDLLPTVADYAGIDIPWQVDGLSARQEPRERADKYFYVDWGQVQRTLPGAELFQRVLNRESPPLPELPGKDLLGRPVAELTVTDGGPPATVGNLGKFGEVDLSSGVVPALVHGDVSDQVPEGTLVAIAVNGRIGAVMPAITRASGERWFVGLIADDGLFVDGENRVELFTVDGDGTNLRRLSI